MAARKVSQSRKVSRMSEIPTIYEPSANTNSVESGRFKIRKISGKLLYNPETDELDTNVEDEMATPNQFTQLYDANYLKEINELTINNLPEMKNYRISVVSPHEARPTIDQLLNNKFKEFQEEQKQREEREKNKPKDTRRGKVVKFGWLEGVLMRCLLNIWGVMLFLRLSWVVGQAGMIQGFLIITLANSVTYLTAFSMSAVATNGKISGGGIYYLVSRSLGPAFGASTGLMFTISNSIAVAVHLVGFCESVLDLMKDYKLGTIVDGAENDIRIIGAGALVFILVLVFVGMEWVTRTQMSLLLILLAAHVNFIVGAIIGPNGDAEKLAKGFTGFKKETFDDNLGSSYRSGKSVGDDSQQNFFSVFGVFFPSVTGIVAGVNLSGDLKDPSSAIPKGTLLAITITYISYVLYNFILGATNVRDATGIIADYPGNFTNCLPDTCDYGLMNSAQVMALSSSWAPLIYAGCFAATLSSAIASLVGAPRVLQALAKDGLYPYIGFFAKGYTANNDPYRGYILVFCVAAGCLSIAKLNFLAIFVSNFFLCSYALINFSTFHASIMKSPGWRPAFKCYNAWLSLLASLMCISVMFLMSWYVALATLVVTGMLFMYVTYNAPTKNWGSSTQAQAYNMALSSTQNLVGVEDHVKNYRPNILVLSGFVQDRPQLIDFTHLLTKNISLMICGHVLRDHCSPKTKNNFSKETYSWLNLHKRKGFYNVIEDKNFENGCNSLIQTAGLGNLKPNIVLLGFKQDWTTPGKRLQVKDYYNVIFKVLSNHLSIGILRVPGGLDYSEAFLGKRRESDSQLTVSAVPLELLEGAKAFNRRMQSQNSKVDETSSSSDDEDEKKNKANKTNQNMPNVTTVNEKEVVKAEDNIPQQQQQVQQEIKTKSKLFKKLSVRELYHGPEGKELPQNILDSLSLFTKKKNEGFIDVYWLFDDGGLTLLLPHMISKRKQFANCKLRIFFLSPNEKANVEEEQKNMAKLIKQFRIDFAEVLVLPDINKRAEEKTQMEFDKIIEPFRGLRKERDASLTVSESELLAVKESTNRYLRLREIIMQYSRDSVLNVVTLPLPRAGVIPAPLYLAWLEVISRHTPEFKVPFFFIRGNQDSVLTYYA